MLETKNNLGEDEDPSYQQQFPVCQLGRRSTDCKLTADKHWIFPWYKMVAVLLGINLVSSAASLILHMRFHVYY